MLQHCTLPASHRLFKPCAHCPQGLCVSAPSPRGGRWVGAKSSPGNWRAQSHMLHMARCIYPPSTQLAACICPFMLSAFRGMLCCNTVPSQPPTDFLSLALTVPSSASQSGLPRSLQRARRQQGTSLLWQPHVPAPPLLKNDSSSSRPTSASRPTSGLFMGSTAPEQASVGSSLERNRNQRAMGRDTAQSRSWRCSWGGNRLRQTTAEVALGPIEGFTRRILNKELGKVSSFFSSSGGRSRSPRPRSTRGPRAQRSLRG